MKKNILLSLLIFCILSSIVPPSALAESKTSGNSDLVPSYTWSCGNPLIDEKVNEKIKDFKENDANMAEKFMVSQVENMFNIGGIAGLNTLVFGNPYCVWMDKNYTLSNDGIFTVKEREKIIDPMLKLFAGAYVAILTLAILLSALKLGFNSMNPQSRADFWQDSKMWMVSALFMVFFTQFTNIIFGLNTAVIIGIKDVLTKSGVEIDGVSIISGFEDMKNVFGVMSLIITFLAEWILSAILNFVYISRKIIILVLLVMGPIAAYSLMFNKSRGFFGVWTKELIGNTFLQSIHAIVLFAFASFSALGAGVIMKLGLMMMFIPVSGMISKWLNIGDSSTKLGQALTMTGLGGIMTTMMVANQAGNIIRGGNLSTFGTNSTLASSAENSLINAGGGSDSQSTRISSLATGSNSSSWQAVKKGTGAVGAFIGGAAGAVTMNPLGIMAGAKAGQKVAEGVLQGSRGTAAGLMNTFSTVKEAAAYTGADGSGFRAFMGNLDRRREFAGNLGESLGSMTGSQALSQMGRRIGHGLSGVSRNDLTHASPSIGGAGGQTWEQISKLNPGAEVMNVQTNRSSAFYMKDQSGQWSQVGIKGAADSSLKNGSVRATSFRLGNAQQGVPQLQPNGSYRLSNGTQGFNSGMNTNSGGTTTMTSNITANVPGAAMGPGIMRTDSVQAPGGIPPINTRSTFSPATSAGIQNSGSTLGSVPSAGIQESPNHAAGIPTGGGFEGSPQNTTVGLPGSTPYLMRTGNSYIVGGGNRDGIIDQSTLVAAQSPNRIVDSTFDASKINPDAYVAYSALNHNANTGSDRMAETLNRTQSTMKSATGWVVSGTRGKKVNERRREIV